MDAGNRFGFFMVFFSMLVPGPIVESSLMEFTKCYQMLPNLQFGKFSKISVNSVDEFVNKMGSAWFFFLCKTFIAICNLL